MEDLEVNQENVDNQENNDYVNDIEDQARSLGWKPKEEFEGNNWIEADKFVELNTKHNGILRRKINELERKIEGISAHHIQIFERELKKKDEEHKQNIAFLKAQKISAIREGDHATAADLDDQIDILKEKGPDLPETPNRSNDWRDNPDVVDFFKENPWVTEDEEMKAYAVGKAQLIRAANPQMSLKEVLNETSKYTKKAFPSKFSTKKNMALNGGDRSNNIVNTKSRTYDSLPADAKAACKDFVSDKYGSKEDYVRMYYEYEDTRDRLKS